MVRRVRSVIVCTVCALAFALPAATAAECVQVGQVKYCLDE